MVVSIVLPVAIQRMDRRRMSAAMRARTWNFATWGASVYAFGPLSMLGWFWVTRPRGTRVWQGAMAAGAALTAVELVDLVVVWRIGAVSPAGETHLADVALLFGVATALGAALLGALELVVAVRRRMH